MRTISFLCLAFAAGAAFPALAQGVGGIGGMAGPNAALGGLPPQDDKKQNLPPPDAVPGARGRPESVIPLKGGTGDLPPTEALFDAINRGDMLTARDAINRGADLDSTNLLGLTPIELSVDLGRNDISFLLLSLRGGGARTAPAGAAALTPAQQRASARVAAAPRPGKVPTTVASRNAQTPKLFAQDGGAPIPAAGFLGFDRH